MKKLLFIFILIPTIGFSATNNGTFTVCDTCNHISLQAAETAHQQDLVSNDSSITFEIKGDEQNLWPDEGAVSISGSTPDATHFMTITSSGTGRHNGIYDATIAYRIVSSSNPSLFIEDPFVVVGGIQINHTSTLNGLFSTQTDITVKNCIVNHTGGTSASANGIQTQSVTGTSLIYNNIVYDAENRGITIGGDAASCLIYNNTVVDCGVGIEEDAGDAVMKNNMFWSNTTDTDVSTANSPSHNATDAASLVGTNNQTSISDPFVAVGSDNFLLSSATSDGAEDGTDLSGTFTDDILGTTRPESTNWDIGAHEFPVAAAVTSSRRRKEIIRGIN